ncbi:unnamed protein product [Trichobilharzia szidati]|nr:unnamed protein product [Trichobilharzia szidati]
MPLKLNFKRTHRYNVAAKDLHVIRIYTLDNTCVEYTVSSNTTGRDALEYVAQRLDIEEIYFFGFVYEDWAGEHRCLFLNKSIKKQLDKYARQHALTLTVMLFIDNPQFIPDPQIRRWFYLQLRRNVAMGLLPVTLKLAIKLQAYSLQAEFGDFVDIETTLSNWRERNLQSETPVVGAFDLSTTEYVDDIVWGYSHLQGVSQDNAIWYFLDEIRHNPLYGVRTFTGMTCRNEVAELGVSRNGINITTFEPQRQTIANLKWEHIKDLTYARKTFTIQLLKKGKSVHFIFEDNESARYLWQFCIQMHSSYIDYWTHVKSVPPQPAVHISEPPDILRGTELRCANSGSPVLNTFVTELSTSQQPSQHCSKYSIGKSNGDSQMNSTNNSDQQPSVAMVNPCNLLNQFRIDSNSTALNSDSRTFRINPPPRRPSEATCAISLNSNCVQTNFVNKPTTVNTDLSNGFKEQHLDSESGTLVGHWSLKSGAGTLDSQLLNKGCVTCLPGRECLKPTGWFHSKNTGVNTTSTSNDLKDNYTDPSSSTPLKMKENPKNGEEKSILSCQQQKTNEVNRENKVSKSHRSHKHRQTKRHHSEQAKSERSLMTDMKGDFNRHEQANCSEHLTKLQLSAVDIALNKKEVCPGQSSPSSLASSDSSSEHVLVSPRASFSSSSSSCTASIKKIDLVHVAQHRSCSSSTSSSSSNSITQADFETNEARKISFGFAASLCTSAHNVTFKGSSKSNTRGINSGSCSTFATGRKLWHELMQSNNGGILPLISGLSQRHYRPQSQMKRHQSAMMAESNVHKLESESLSSKHLQTSYNSKETTNDSTSHIHKSVTHLSSSNNPLHEFQRWFSSAKTRMPFGWTNNNTSRGTTMHISAPLSYQTSENCCKTQATKSENERRFGVTSNSVSPTPHHNLSNQFKSQTGRLERSSSESYSRLQLNNSKGDVTANLENSKLDDVNSQKMKSFTINTSNTQGNESKILTPTIHLLPPSPTRPQMKINGNKQVNIEKSDSHDINLPSASCSKFNVNSQDNEGDKKHFNTNPVYNKSDMDNVNMISETKEDILKNPQLKISPRPLNQLSQHEQGNFRTSSSSSWRLFPCPLTINEVNRLAVTPPRKFVNSPSENYCLSLAECHSNRLVYGESGYQKSNFDHHTNINANLSYTTITEEVLCKPDEKLQNMKHSVGGNINQRHFSTTPTTPVSRPNFIWGDNFEQPYEHKIPQEISNPLPEQDECDGMQQTNVNSNGTVINPTNDNKTFNDSLNNMWSLSNHQSKSKCIVGAENYSPETMENSQELESKQLSNTLLTTSSSSDQCSIPRPSSGTMHLLTNSDIHQLLSLTNLRETELAHRLLAEYRQVLLHQQSLHTNSVSTPNLSASQELQMLSSSTAAEDIEGHGEQMNSSNQEKSRNTWNKASDECKERSKNHRKNNHISSNSMRNPSDALNNNQTGVKFKIRRNRNVEIQSIDSPDYVNAAAFRNDRRTTNDRPLSLASSTDIDSNATFRVLSSFEMRTSSGGNYSTGNLIIPNGSMGSEETTMGLSVDLTNPDSQPGIESTTSQSSNKSSDQGKKSTKEKNIIVDHRDKNSNREVYSHENVTRTDGDDLNTYNQPPDVCMVQKGSSFSIKDYLNKPRFKGECNQLSSSNQQGIQGRRVIGEYENLEAISYEKNKKNCLPNHLYNSTHQHQDGGQCGSLDSHLQSSTMGKTLSMSHNTPPASVSTLTRSGASTTPSPSTYSASSSLSSSSSYSDLGCIDTNQTVLSRKHSLGLRTCNNGKDMSHSSPWHQFYHLENGVKLNKNHRTEGRYDIPLTIITPRFKKRIKYCNCGCHASVDHFKIIKGSSSRAENTNNLSLMDVSNPTGHRRIKQKARSFEPFSKIIKVKPSEHHYTSVCFEDVNKGVVPSESASSNIQEYQRKHFKSSNRKLHHIITSHIPININRLNHQPCCHCEKIDRHSHDDVSTSVTTSPTDSPCLSSASSYSFSTSSLDVQPAFNCPHHLHIPSYTSVVIAHKSERNHRGGSLEPNNAIHRSVSHKSKLKHFSKSSKRQSSVRKEHHDANSQSTCSFGLRYAENYKREHCSCCEFHETANKKDLLENYERNNNSNKLVRRLPSRLPHNNNNNNSSSNINSHSSTHSKHLEHDLNNDEKPPTVKKKSNEINNNNNNMNTNNPNRGQFYSNNEKKLHDSSFTTKDSSSSNIVHHNRSIPNLENENSVKPPRPKDLKLLSRNQNFGHDLKHYRSSSNKRISFFKKKIPSESQITAHIQNEDADKSVDKEYNPCSSKERKFMHTTHTQIHTPLPSPDLICRSNTKKNDFTSGTLRSAKGLDFRRETSSKTDGSLHGNKTRYEDHYPEHENVGTVGAKVTGVRDSCQEKDTRGSFHSNIPKPYRESIDSPTKSFKQKSSPTNEFSPSRALVYTASVVFNPTLQRDTNHTKCDPSSLGVEKSRRFGRQSEPKIVPLLRSVSIEPTLKKDNAFTDSCCSQSDTKLKDDSHLQLHGT